MLIRPATALRKNYDDMVKLSREKREPIFLTRNDAVEMVLLPIELWEKREVELDMLDRLLRREQNRIEGAKTYSLNEMGSMTEEILAES